ncbi:hypothetical protein D9619_000002 [Psilocybe cf. subviscida]|uniref:Uncharacterized protein n=1 Tax=Psilocybe cf. subviscida TaxID=2480587 RepID=A0A8H5BCL2_9AGAR|nr:hypothetical protein D9619_000002 [Psilocybe cf. subviscida]
MGLETPAMTAQVSLSSSPGINTMDASAPASASASGRPWSRIRNGLRLLRLLRRCDVDVDIGFELDFDDELPFSAATATTTIDLDGESGLALGTSSDKNIVRPSTRVASGSSSTSPGS